MIGACTCGSVPIIDAYTSGLVPIISACSCSSVPIIGACSYSWAPAIDAYVFFRQFQVIIVQGIICNFFLITLNFSGDMTRWSKNLGFDDKVTENFMFTVNISLPELCEKEECKGMEGGAEWNGVMKEGMRGMKGNEGGIFINLGRY